MEKQFKKSKLTGFEHQELNQYMVDLDKDVYNLFQYTADIGSAGTYQTSNNFFTYVYMGSDTYWRMNTATHYLEGWVEGIKRMEI